MKDTEKVVLYSPAAARRLVKHFNSELNLNIKADFQFKEGTALGIFNFDEVGKENQIRFLTALKEQELTLSRKDQIWLPDEDLPNLSTFRN